MNTDQLALTPTSVAEARSSSVAASCRPLVQVCALVLLWALANTVPAASPQIVSGSHANCLLRQDGRVSCWGYAENGQTSPPAGPFEQISLGTWSGCGLRASGQVECWGAQNLGFPVEGLLDVPEGTYTQVDAGDNFHCAVRDDQKIVCWGRQVGGVYIPYTGEDDRFVSVSAGYVYFCGIRTSGALACGGLQNAPTPPPGAFTHVTADEGRNFTLCGISTDGQSVCWGNDAYKQTQTPVGQFLTVGVGVYHACGLQTDGTITCWGYFGNQDYRQYFPPPGQYTSLGVGNLHNCALRVDGVTVCWGINGSGEAPKLRIEPKIVLAAEVGVAYSASLSMADKGTIWTYAPYNPVDPILSVAAGQLPPGFSLSAGGQLEGTASSTGSWPLTLLAQDDNGYEVERDLAFTVVQPGEDVTPPEIAPVITGLNEMGDWYRSDVTVAWEVSDPESDATSQVGCQIAVVDQDTARPGTSFTCSARSIGGVTSETVELRRDATPPTVQITSVETIDTGYYRINFTASDEVSDVAFAQCSVDDGGFSFCDTWSYDLVLLGPGEHTVHVRAADNAGNYSAPVSTIVNDGPADTSPPVIMPNVIGTVGDNGWYRSDVSISWSVTDDQSAISSSTGCDPSSVLSDTASASFTCSATSSGGTAQESVIIKRDAGEPETSLTTAPANPSDLGPATFEFNGTDAMSGVAGFTCSLDGAAYTACATPHPVTGLAVGPHTFAVRSTDVAGNVDATPANHSWSIQSSNDLTPPVASPTLNRTPNQAGWINANVTVSWNWTDLGSGINAAQCTTETSVTIDGVRTVTAQCRDLAGNVGAASILVRVDKTPPSMTPFISPDAEIVIRDSTSTAVPSARDSLSGLASQSCPPLVTTAVGSQSVTCTAADVAGNVATAKANYSVVYGLQTYNPPVAGLPTLNVVSKTLAFPLRWRLVDALGAPITNLKPGEVKLYGFETAVSNCVGVENRITQGSNKKQLANLGNGNYEIGPMFGKNWPGSCSYFYFGPPIQFKLALFRTL